MGPHTPVCTRHPTLRTIINTTSFPTPMMPRLGSKLQGVVWPSRLQTPAPPLALSIAPSHSSRSLYPPPLSPRPRREARPSPPPMCGSRGAPRAAPAALRPPTPSYGRGEGRRRLARPPRGQGSRGLARPPQYQGEAWGGPVMPRAADCGLPPR